jgi:tetratricopeptide (TPR) repeat protein
MHASYTAEEHFLRGQRKLDEGDAAGALDCFRTAQALEPESARYRSFYGLGLALVDRRLDRALDLCRSAAKQEFYNPELYRNLARVHLAFGFKAEGIRYLRRGLMIDPAHTEIRADLTELGMRSSPVLRFLPRKHLVNRWLGRWRQIWSERNLPLRDLDAV